MTRRRKRPKTSPLTRKRRRRRRARGTHAGGRNPDGPDPYANATPTRRGEGY